MKKEYIKDVIRFYLTPHPRAILTTFFLVVYGYFVLYYFDNARLAFHFIIYTLTSGTALLSIGHLFWYLLFLVSILSPFLVSAYAIFVLYESWHLKRDWDPHFRTSVTAILIVISIFIIVFMNSAARVIAREDYLRGFVEDNDLAGRI